MVYEPDAPDHYFRDGRIQNQLSLEDGQWVTTGGIQHVSEGMVVETGDGPTR